MTQVLGVRAARWIPSLVVCGLAGVAVHIFGMTLAPAALAQDRGTNAPALREVVAAVPRSWPPQYSVDENGKPVGFAIDVMEEIAALAGLRVIYHIKDSFLEATKAVRDGRADIIPNMGIIPEREVTFAFTAPVETFRISIFVRGDTLDIKGMPDLTDRRVAVVKGNVGYLRLKHRKDMDLAVFEDVRTALFELVAGQVDALVYPQPVIMGLAEQIGVEDRIRVAGEPLFEVKRGISVHKDNTELLAVLDKAVERFVGTPAYERIYVKWFGRPMPFWTVSRVMWTMGGLVIVILVAAAGWRYQSVVKLNRELYATITGRKRAEEALLDSEERFRTIAANVPGNVYRRILHPDGRTSRGWRAAAGDLTPGLRDVMEMDPDEVMTRPELVVKTLHPEDRARWQDALRKSAETLEPFVLEYRRIRPSGKVVWLRSIARTHRREDGAVVWDGVTLDITERKQAEEALRESEERFRVAFENAPVGVALITLEGNRFQVNQALADFLGYTKEELTNTDMKSTAANLDDLNISMRLRQQVLDGEITTYRNERRYRHKQGHVVWGEISGSLLRNEDGEPVHFIAHTIDITERKRAEEALRENEERFRQIYENTPGMFHSIDKDGRLLSVSDHWLDTLGYDREEVLGRKVYEFYSEESRRYAKEETLPEFFRTGFAKELPFQVVKKNGEVMDVLLTAMAVRDDQGNFVRSL
ncbi:MAG: PAS domain S-box protein, partial [Proteobacteria bacterium]|nr:PAS domain S-box protein [Pseudomonadota bacterium]